MITTISLRTAWLATMAAFVVVSSTTVASSVELPPVKYVTPFEVVAKDGGYKQGEELIVQVHFCFADGVEKVFYNSITQSFIPTVSGAVAFTDPIIDMIVDKESVKKNGVYYTDMEGYECIKAYGAPKKIPAYLPDGCYRMHFVASVDGKRKKHILEYDSQEFCINGTDRTTRATNAAPRSVRAPSEGLAGK